MTLKKTLSFNSLSKSNQSDLIDSWKVRNKDLKKNGIPVDTFEQYLDWVFGKGKKIKANNKSLKNNNRPVIKKADNKISSLSSWVTGPCSSKKIPAYTGENIVGISILHKSCLQPIFSKQEAIDVANMRR
jgi:hypothetical protein